MPIDYMHALLCAFFPDQIFTVIRHNQIIGLMKISPSASSPDFLSLFQDLLEKMNYTAGLSNFFTDLSLIRTFFYRLTMLFIIFHIIKIQILFNILKIPFCLIYFQSVSQICR